jgi:hypothetical protein
MLLSHRYRFIFIHVYKVAGTSMRAALEPYCEDQWKRTAARFLKRAGVSWPALPPRHLQAAKVRDMLPPEVFASYFKFAFVRNPWDWQVSLYHYMRQRDDHQQSAFIQGLDGFDTYIRWRVAEDLHLQREFVCDPADGRMLVDYIGRIETVDPDFAEICRITGLPPIQLPHVNRSKHRDYRSYYTDETRELVARAFRDDIETFGYTFDGLAEREPVSVGRTG